MISTLGIIGGIVLVLGAAWPAHKVSHPIKSIKNWGLALGALIMLVFATLDYYYNQAPIFFILLQLLVNTASVLMMMKAGDKTSTILLSIIGTILIGFSLFIFEDFSTALFILGLLGVGIGYALETGTIKRNVALLLGSILITIFSYLGASWIFFWLNAFFALFSAWHIFRLYKNK